MLTSENEIIKIKQQELYDLKQQDPQTFDEAKQLIEKYRKLSLELFHLLRGLQQELSDEKETVKTLQRNLNIITNRVQKAQNTNFKKHGLQQYKKYATHIIQATKRASVLIYQSPFFPVKSEEIAKSFRVLYPDIKIATETITRIVRKLATEPPYPLIRVEKGLYKVNPALIDNKEEKEG